MCQTGSQTVRCGKNYTVGPAALALVYDNSMTAFLQQKELCRAGLQKEEMQSKGASDKGLSDLKDQIAGWRIQGSDEQFTLHSP